MREVSPYLLQRSTPVSVEAIAEFPNPPSEERPESNLLDYWRMIRRNVRMIGTIVMVTMLLAGLLVFLERPVYTATTTLLIERNNPQVLEIPQILPESAQDELDAGYYATQYALLKGRTLATTVIKEEGLERYAFIAPDSHRSNGLTARVYGSAKSWLVRLLEQNDDQGHQEIDGIKSTSIDNYLKGLDIAPIRGTRLVQVHFTSPDRVLSARIANAHAAAYIRQRLELRTNTNEQAERFLEAKLVELKSRIERSEAALNTYRRENGVISLNSREDNVMHEFDELSKDLTAAEADRISLEAQEKLVQSQRYESIPAVLNSQLIQRLKQQVALVEARYANLTEEFKPGLPAVDQIRAELDDTNARLHHEIRNVVDGIQSAYQAAVINENELRARVEQERALVLRQKDIGVQYGILAREVNTNQQLYNAVLQRMKETQVAAEVSASNIFMIDKAEVPQSYSRPKRSQEVLIAAMFGLVVGIGVAFFRESLDNTLKSPQEVERVLRLPNLATLPDLSRAGNVDRKTSNDTLHEQLPSLANVNSDNSLAAWYAESYRTLRNSIMLSRAGAPPRVLLVTSALNAEGKTVVSVNTAACFARTGMKVLLIDADLRRPHCHQMLEVDNRLGLSEVLAGHVQLEQTLMATSVKGLSLLPAGAHPPDPAELVGSSKMRQILAHLSEAYDFVVVDAAPAMLVSDAISLSAMVDGTLMVVDSRATPRQAAVQACARLKYVGARIIGVVLNRVDVHDSDSFYSNYFGHYENSYY